MVKRPGSDHSDAVSGARPNGSGIRALVLTDDLESVTLVDTDDNEIGSCAKLIAHRDGKLHRAFSILISNRNGELLLQRRAVGKYHFAGQWSNSCCGHPRPGERTRWPAQPLTNPDGTVSSSCFFPISQHPGQTIRPWIGRQAVCNDT